MSKEEKILQLRQTITQRYREHYSLIVTFPRPLSMKISQEYNRSECITEAKETFNMLEVRHTTSANFDYCHTPNEIICHYWTELAKILGNHAVIVDPFQQESLFVANGFKPMHTLNTPMGKYFCWSGYMCVLEIKQGFISTLHSFCKTIDQRLANEDVVYFDGTYNEYLAEKADQKDNAFGEYSNYEGEEFAAEFYVNVNDTIKHIHFTYENDKFYLQDDNRRLECSSTDTLLLNLNILISQSENLYANFVLETSSGLPYQEFKRFGLNTKQADRKPRLAKISHPNPMFALLEKSERVGPMTIIEDVSLVIEDVSEAFDFTLSMDSTAIFDRDLAEKCNVLLNYSRKKALWNNFLVVNDGENVSIYRGATQGVLTYRHPAMIGFGFDCRFKPDGTTETLYELDRVGEKDPFSARKKAVEALLNNRPIFKAACSKIKDLSEKNKR
jgi:hypothetical protein